MTLRLVEAQLSIYYSNRSLQSMYNERFASRDSEEAYETTLRLDHRQIRRTIKDLREYVQESSPRFPNRDQALRLIEELLILVPPLSEEDEQVDDRRRRMDQGEIEAYTD